MTSTQATTVAPEANTSTASAASEQTSTQPEVVGEDRPAQKEAGQPKIRKLPRKRIIKVLSVGMEMTGKVKRTSEFGAFVDIGVGRDGLLHISELSTKRVRKVTDVVKEGDEVTVWIKDLDRARNRISLTMIPPGTKTIRDLSEGDLVTGTVQRLTSYGAFVDIGLERDALLHVKEMSDGYVRRPEDVVKVGDEIEARIIRVNRRRGQVDLSLKGLRPPNQSERSREDVELAPLGYSDEDDDVPTLMELALRQAFGDELPVEGQSKRRRKGRRKRRQRRDIQQEIIARTLRYHEERG